jgi:hypothetical protein
MVVEGCSGVVAGGGLQTVVKRCGVVEGCRDLWKVVKGRAGLRRVVEG